MQKMHSLGAFACSGNVLNCARARPKTAIQKSNYHFRLRYATEAREQKSATESSSLGKC